VILRSLHQHWRQEQPARSHRRKIAVEKHDDILGLFDKLDASAEPGRDKAMALIVFRRHVPIAASVMMVVGICGLGLSLDLSAVGGKS
jgi:hypothetical protein